MEVVRFIFDTILLGIEHILIGIDHILFVISLILIWVSWKHVFRVITAFTIWHSLSLILGWLHIISLPSAVVESIIALSIIYVVISSLVFKKTESNVYIVLIFWVFHGLWFASVFWDLGFSTYWFWTLFLALICFNIWVEIGQALIIALVSPIIIFLKKYHNLNMYCTYLTGTIITLLASYWFIQRAFNL